MEESKRAYFKVQVEEKNADEVWLALKKMTGVVEVGEYYGEPD